MKSTLFGLTRWQLFLIGCLLIIPNLVAVNPLTNLLSLPGWFMVLAALVGWIMGAVWKRKKQPPVK